jgi:hypothetical protein
MRFYNIMPTFGNDGKLKLLSVSFIGRTLFDKTGNKSTCVLLNLIRLRLCGFSVKIALVPLKSVFLIRMHYYFYTERGWQLVEE